MKTIEEKAKAYDEALKAAIAAHKDEDRHLKATLERIFPELQESEDERIRKSIICGMNALKEQGKETFATIPINDCIAWLEKQGESYTKKDVDDAYLKGISDAKQELEKQGEQKSVLDFKASNWYVSKVDGKIHDMTYNPVDKVEPKFKVKYAGSEYNVLEVKDIAGVTFYGIEDEPNHIDYVKAENCEIISGYAIKENGSPYPTKPAVFSEKKPTAWSEEDENYLQSAENACEYQYGKNTSTILWLKSLKERNTWKPSKEQMEALDDALNERGFDYNDLNSLYEQLKKL